MLQNGQIILTVWGLMRMANFTHDYDYIDLPIVNFPYLSSNIPESHTNDVFDLQFIYVMFKILRFSVQMIYFGFKGTEA